MLPIKGQLLAIVWCSQRHSIAAVTQPSISWEPSRFPAGSRSRGRPGGGGMCGPGRPPVRHRRHGTGARPRRDHPARCRRSQTAGRRHGTAGRCRAPRQEPCRGAAPVAQQDRAPCRGVRRCLSGLLLRSHSTDRRGTGHPRDRGQRPGPGRAVGLGCAPSPSHPRVGGCHRLIPCWPVPAVRRRTACRPPVRRPAGPSGRPMRSRHSPSRPNS